MATDVASADAEKKPDTDTKPKAVEEKHDGTGAASTAPTVQRAAGTSLGQRQVQAKSAHGNARIGDADDSAERKADMAANHVMRMPDTSPAPPATSGSSPASGSTSAPTPAAGPSPASAGPSPASVGGSTATPEEPVRRTEDPTAEQRLPGAETAKPATPGTGAAPAAGPDTMTPAGPAPLIAPPATAGARPAETGTPAPDAEPPAPEGEAPARETPQVPNDVQEYLDASRGMGAPLPDATLKFFEDKFQRPFDDVRIHDDGGADDAAKKIDALAFTRGNDIYFRSGAYDPTTAQGKGVLAHELAHVVQQRPGINRKTAPGLGGTVIRRAKTGGKEKDTVPDDEKKPVWTAPPDTKPQGTIDTTTTPRTLVIDELSFPRWKEKASNITDGPYRWRRGKRPSTPQLENWKKGVREATKAKTIERLIELYGEHAADDPYFAKSGTSTDRGKLDFYVGSPEQIAEMILVPTWSRTTGEYNRFDVDHKIDWQLYGGDDFPNIWLFDREVNQAEGTKQLHRIQTQVGSFLDNAMPYLKPRPRANLPGFDISFKKLKFEGASAKGGDFWEKEHAGTQAHVRGLQKLSPKEIKGLGGREDNLQIFSAAGGGRVRRLAYDTENKKPKEEWTKTVGKNQLFEVQEVDFQKISDKGGTGNAGRVKGIAFKDERWIRKTPFKVDLNGLPGLPYAASLTKADIKAEMEARGLSQITFADLEFDPFDGFIGRGKILPSSKLLERVDVDLVLTGEGVGIEANITGDDLNLPGPFRVTGGLLSLYAGTDGLAVKGKLNFEIEKIATGFVQAKASYRTGVPSFALDAELQFDKKMFDGDTKIKGFYEDGKWAVEGTLGVEPGKIKGIKKASATVKVSEDTVTADGEFETSLKGVDKGKLGFKYNEATGMEITGEIILGQGIPGVKSGKLDATIKEGPTGHSLSGGVTLEPSVPGLTGTVTGRYEDGAFLVEADLGYEKGLAKGKVNVGLTNQEVDEHGKPSGPPKPDGSVTAFGTGLVTLTLTPWLKGTVGLKLTPKGEIEVSGEVALPSEFEVFGRLPLEKEIFSVHIDVPIIGLSVAGVHVGIFATIGGGATVSAGVGPGVLRDVALKVTYNPDKPDDTTVTGTGSFAIPAHASLRLTVDGGVGAGIPLVDAEAKLSAYGEVGVAGEVSAGVQVDWAPRTGIVLDARGDIFVEPRFRFGVDASVEVTVGVWRLTKTLYEHTWHLANFEYGSSLRFGLSLPIHYESLKPFDIAFDQIQWTYPQIEPKDLLSGLMKQLVG